MLDDALSAGQCRAARALLGWSQDDLVARSRVSKSSIANFEAARTTPQARTLADLRAALEAAGVVFLAAGETTEGGEGVRLKGA